MWNGFEEGKTRSKHSKNEPKKICFQRKMINYINNSVCSLPIELIQNNKMKQKYE